MIESALAMLVFAVLIAGILEVSFATFVCNSVAFAAQRAARFAAARGSTSGHPATAAEVQATARAYAGPLSAGALDVAVTWTPDNSPGSTVFVKVSCRMQPMLPLSATGLTLQGMARQPIAQ